MKNKKKGKTMVKLNKKYLKFLEILNKNIQDYKKSDEYKKFCKEYLNLEKKINKTKQQ